MTINLHLVLKRTLIILIAITAVTLNSVRGQYQFFRADTELIRDEAVLPMAWAGGLNSAQYNTLDLNADGVDDLVIFDRTSNKLSTFLTIDGDYSYRPQYESFFPENLVSWVLLRDFDCDGFNDIFTDSQLGMRVFRNMGTNPLSWELIEDPVTTLGTQTINLFFNASDIPSINDLDNDGDLDVLAFNFATGENIEYHRNMSVEKTGECGLDFERISRNYGNLSECDCGEFIFTGPCPVNGRRLHAGGKTILSIDLDGDGDHELFTGEETCDDLSVLTNFGDVNTALFTQATDFFIENPPSIPYPAAFHLDLDHDGLLDLGVSTNFRSNDDFVVDLSNSSYFYRNTGDATNPQFQLIETNFLQKNMLDVGERATPAFADFDRDGDQDLFIGNAGSLVDNSLRGTVYLFENTGTIDDPRFTFVTDDYASLSRLGYTNLKPQFRDINDNGRNDLLITGNASLTDQVEMVYFINTSMFRYEFDTSSPIMFSDLSQLADYPLVEDIDLDGTLDLLIGRRIGTLEFYRNTGTNETPNFELADPNF